MTDVGIQNWDEINIHEIAQLTFDAWQAQGRIRRSDGAIEKIENGLRELQFDIPPLVVLARSAEKLVGWLLLYIHNSTTAEINPWWLNGHPIVSPENDSDIASKLLEQTIDYVKKKGLTRVEMIYSKIEEETEQIHEKCKAWYESRGMNLVEEIVHVKFPLTELEIRSVEFPPSFEIKPLLEINEEELYQCFHETFRTSEDRWVKDMIDEELRGVFNDLIHKPSLPIIESASIALLKDNQLIGFSLARYSHGEGNGHLWVIGIHPSFRRRGLGKTLMLLIKKRLVQLGLRSMSLNYDRINQPAHELYQSLGFKVKWRKIVHAWKVGDT